MDAVIFCNGDLCKFNIINGFVDLNKSIVIGVDGGCNYLLSNNIKINIAIGDFDSINNEEVLKNLSNIRKTNLDYSDLEMAIEYCINEKYSKVYLFGCTGKRADHFIFNFRLMEKLYNNNIETYMIDDYNVMTLFCGYKHFYKNKYKFFSIIPLYENTRISIEGSKYDLNNKKLNLQSSLTLSNEWINEIITLNSNKLVCICLVF